MTRGRDYSMTDDEHDESNARRAGFCFLELVLA